MSFLGRLLTVSAILLTACSNSSLSTQKAGPIANLACVIPDQGLSPKEKDAITDLRHSVESGPLYAAGGELDTCGGKSDAGAISLEYRFKNGGWLHVKRDVRIEYNDQEAHFETALAQDPVALMKRAESAAFGSAGCGMDWSKFETQPSSDDPNSVETIFRGDTCNCQARIRKSPDGKTTGLRLRSTC